MPPQDDKLEPGFVTEAFTSPWVSIPYALAVGLAAGATPGTGRAARGLNTGLGFALNAEQTSYQRQKEQRVSEALKALGGAPTTGSTTPAGINPQARLSQSTLQEATLPDPVTGLPPSRVSPTRAPAVSSAPQGGLPPVMREYLRKVAPHDPKAGINLYGEYVKSQLPQDFTLGPGQSRFKGRREIASQPGVAKAPLRIDLGDKIQLLDPDTREVIREIPKGRAPASNISEQTRRLNEEKIRSTRALAMHREEAMRIARDPNSTISQLSSAMNSLLAERKDFETAPEEIPEITDAIRVLRRRIAKAGEPKVTPKGSEKTQGSEKVQPKKVKSEKVPDAKSYKHVSRGGTSKVIMTDDETGQRFFSDGTKWIRIFEGNTEGLPNVRGTTY